LFADIPNTISFNRWFTGWN